MYTSGVQSITQNKNPIKLPWTKQFGHKTISNQFFESFALEQNWNKPNYIGKKIKCENWVSSTSQGNLTSAGFRICYNWGQLRSEDRVIIEMIAKMISTCRFKDFSLVNKINVLTFSKKIFILEFNSEIEIIKEAGPYIALNAFTLDQ